MPATPAPLASRAVRAAKRSGSLRVTVPQVVAATLGLTAGDEVLWIIEADTSKVRVEARRTAGPDPAD